MRPPEIRDGREVAQSGVSSRHGAGHDQGLVPRTHRGFATDHVIESFATNVAQDTRPAKASSRGLVAQIIAGLKMVVYRGRALSYGPMFRVQ